MPNTKPKVILLRHTFQPEELAAMAATLRYSRADVVDLKAGIEE